MSLTLAERVARYERRAEQERRGRELRMPPQRYHPVATPMGWCPLCREPVLDERGEIHRRRRWHPLCVIAWKVATQPEAQRRVCDERDHAVCAECGFDCNGPENFKAKPVGNPCHTWEDGERDVLYQPIWFVRLKGWHADHIVPLWSVDPDADDAWKYWTVENLATLCVDCHRAKTAREAAARAKSNRIRAKLAGTGNRQRRQELPF